MYKFYRYKRFSNTVMFLLSSSCLFGFTINQEQANRKTETAIETIETEKIYNPQKLKREYTSQKHFIKKILKEMRRNHVNEEDMSSITTQYLNIPYAHDSNAQKLDIFMPEGKGPFPSVILIHGGAFKAGDKSNEYMLAKKLVNNGFVAISINYRLSAEATFPTPVHDCKAAVRYVRAHAKKYNINPDKIGTWGASAGGYFASMLGTSSHDVFLNGAVGDYADVSTEVHAVINWYGPIDFSTMIPQSKALGFPSDYSVENETRYLGADANDSANAELVTKANPATYLDKNTPPFWIAVGSQDPLIPYLQSQYFAEKIAHILGKDKVEFNRLEGVGHGGELFETEQNLNKAINFFNKHLK